MTGTGRNRPSTGRADGGDPIWRVFVSLRDAPGLFERRVQASSALEAEERVSHADRRVLETLGAQRDGVEPVPDGGDRVYRALETGGRRFLRLRPHGVGGDDPLSPYVEFVCPKG